MSGLKDFIEFMVPCPELRMILTIVIVAVVVILILSILPKPM